MIVNGAVLNAVALNAKLTTSGAQTGAAVLALRQVISNPQGATALVLRQSVAGHGSCGLSLRQNVFSVASVNYANWAVRVMVAGVDISADLVGSLSIDAERNAARLADFTVQLSGVVDANAWIGKPVSIDYVQDDGSVWRRFTGIIVVPSLNVTDMEMTCRCSDDLQRIIDGMSTADILSMTGGYWSKYVFSEDAVGWDYLQDVLTTVPVSIERNALGQVLANSWQNKSAADFTYDHNIIDDGSMSVDIVQRSSLVNTVEITFDARFERLYHREVSMQWVHNVTFCANYDDPILYPTKTMVRSALDSAGWTLLAERYAQVWSTGAYTCSGTPIAWTNIDADLIRQFNIRAAYRWQQSVTHSYKVNVFAPAEAVDHGELKTSLRGAASFVSDVQNWGESGSVDSALPSGFLLDEDNNRYRDEIDSVGLSTALQTIIQQGIETISKSYRSNTLTCALPLAPYLELSHTVAIDTAVDAKGVLSRIVERYDFDSAEATSEITLSLSRGLSGLDVVVNGFSLPVHPMQTPATISSGIVDVPSHIGGKASAPLLLETDWGVLTNYEVLEVGGEVYPREIRLQFDAIPDTKTQNVTMDVPLDIVVQIPTNTLTITA